MTPRRIAGVTCAVLTLGSGGAVLAVHALSSAPAHPRAEAPAAPTGRVIPRVAVPQKPKPVAPTSAAPVAPAAQPTKVVRTRTRTVTIVPSEPATPVHPVSVPRAAVTRKESPTQRGTRVLGTLHYDWRRLGYRLVFRPERAHYLGLTDVPTKTITIWVRDSQSDLVLAHTIAHELGHALDFSHGNLVKRKSYLALRGINPLTPWFGCDGCTDYSSPAGDWAEVFAYYLAGPGDFRSQMAAAPTRSQLKAIALLYRY